MRKYSIAGRSSEITGPFLGCIGGSTRPSERRAAVSASPTSARAERSVGSRWRRSKTLETERWLWVIGSHRGARPAGDVRENGGERSERPRVGRPPPDNQYTGRSG